MRSTGITIGLCALSAFLFSCSDHRGVKFPETVPVVTSQHGFDSVDLRYPYRVRLFDSTLYVMDLHADEFYCHKFTYPDLKFVRSFARRGKAPDELISIGNINVGAQGKVYVLNDFGRKMYIYDSKSGQFNQLAEFPVEMLYYSDFALYDDSTFVFPDYYGQCRLFFADRNGAIIRKMGNIPVKEKAGDIPEAALGSAWRAFIGYNPHNGIAALATQFGEVLEIYNLHNNTTKIVVGTGGEPKCKFRGAGAIPDGILGYSDVFVGEKNIYALFWGHEYKKIMSGEITVEGGNYIHVFDLEGNPIRRYELDCYITGFFVDEAAGEVIGTDVNEEHLVVFHL